MKADALVVGAGIVGAACAAELAARGMKVEVFEAGGIGCGATAAGMGHIVVMNDTPAEFALARHSRDLWLALAPQLRRDDAFHRCGTLWAAADEEEWQAARALHETFATHRLRAHLLDQAALHQCEPQLAPSLVGGLLVEDDAIVYAPRAAQWLLAESSGHRNIALRTESEVVAVDARTVTLASGERVGADVVVVANGLAATRLIPSLPLRAKKGHLVITDRYPGFISHQLLELGYIKSAHRSGGTSVAFNAQARPTGQLLLGSSRQFDTTDPDVEVPVLAQMLARCEQYLPGLARLNALRAWTGFRAATPDGLPLIGPAPPGSGVPGVWMATGHEGLGVTTSLATAKLLAAQLFSTDAPIDVAPYLPGRFCAAVSAG
ncbi:NAD(P)/FAD-dependent oxidoreductase [Trinickia sp. EG282A]|uniref:NAD(P)/FAD-dependent oxidoreductase n=1 Tax=Trinickia sp. EG282A TaxID=3237013 RepID=UPI0034D2FB51